MSKYLFLLFLIIGVVGCAKSDDSNNCKSYVSPYEVEFPDNSVRKSDVASCFVPLGLSYYKATDLSQSRESFSAKKLTIRLLDLQTGQQYLTEFQE